MGNFHDENSETLDMQHVADLAQDDLVPGKITKGEIVTIDSSYAYVNVGTKSDGRVPLDEFDVKPSVGDVINVVLKSRKFVDGVYHFSKKAADEESGWQEFLKTYNSGDGKIKGKVVSSTNRGKIVNCFGISAFLPFSLAADLKGVSTSEELFFKVKDLDQRKKSILLSRKDIVDEENNLKWDSFLSKYKVGDLVKGKVLKFVEFGAFVRVDGLDALLHRNDMSWKKVFKQRKLLKIDEERDFLILGINREDGKISLGLKQLVEDPWTVIDTRYAVGSRITGIVTTLTNFGAFVEIDDGVEGFLSNSEISWTKSSVSVNDLFKKGDSIEVQVLNINREEKKLSLGYKQLQMNPWNEIEKKFPVGTVLKKKIKKVVKFGIFVEIDAEIDGLVHLSDLSWDDKVKPESFKAGTEVEFKILDIKKEDKKISCGIKQLSKSPWAAIAEKYPPRTTVNGTVSGITQFGLFVKIEDDVEGLVHISEVSRKRLENLEEHFKIGDKVTAVVLGVDIDKKRLSLSIKHFDVMNEKEELEKILVSNSPAKVTIGDMVKIKLGE